MRQGLGAPEECGPNAPRTVAALMALVNEAAPGLCLGAGHQQPGAAAMAANIVHPQTGRAIGNLSVAGPSLRLGEAHATRSRPSSSRPPPTWPRSRLLRVSRGARRPAAVTPG